MAEIEINGVHYVTNRLGVIDSWHCARKLIPYLVSTGPLSRIGDEAAGGDLNPEHFDQALKSMADAIAAMSYADWNFVINICLGVVRRRDDAGNLRPVIQLIGPPEQKGQLLYENEMSWATMLKLVMEVANTNVTPFLPELLPSLMGLRTNGATGEPMAIAGSQTA